MNIHGIKICGKPAKLVRNLFRALDSSPLQGYFSDGQFVRVRKELTEAFIQRHMAMSPMEAVEFLRCLRECGLIEKDAALPTQAAAQLREASAMMQIHRETADRIIQDVLQVARQINALGSETAKVSSIDVFGSYIAGAAKLSDIDLIVGVPELDPYGPEGGVDEQIDVFRKLKVSRYVSIHPLSDSIASASNKVPLFP